MQSGDEFIAANKLYGGSINQFNHAFKSFGWNVVWADADNPASFEAAITYKTEAIFIESLANPGGIVMDIEAIAAIDRPIDMVDVFRGSAAVPGVVEECLKLDPLPKVIWTQLTVYNEEAAKLAESHGIKMVMDRCPKIEYGRLCGEIGWVGVASNVITSKKPKLQEGYQRFGITSR